MQSCAHEFFCTHLNPLLKAWLPKAHRDSATHRLTRFEAHCPALWAALTLSNRQQETKQTKKPAVGAAEFARRIGVSQGTLSKYEQGRAEIGAEVLLRIAREFKRTIEWQLTGD